MPPDDVQIWEERGAAALLQRRYFDAAQAYRRAVSLDAERAVSWDGLGRAELGLRHYEQALQAFYRALALDPDRGRDAGFWTNRGWALLKIARLEDALASFDNGLRLDRHQYPAWVGKGQTLLHLRRFRALWSTSWEMVSLYAGTSVKDRWQR